MRYEPEQFHFLLERMPLALRENPSVSGTESEGTPFLIKGPVKTELQSHRRVGSYFVHLTFFYCLFRQFGFEPFERRNLDAKRLGYLLGDGVLQMVDRVEDLDRLWATRLRIVETVSQDHFPAAFVR